MKINKRFNIRPWILSLLIIDIILMAAFINMEFWNTLFFGSALTILLVAAFIDIMGLYKKIKWE